MEYRIRRGAGGTAPTLSAEHRSPDRRLGRQRTRTALLNTALGDSAAYLRVLENNPRARAFYGQHGFQPDGERKLLPAEWSELPEIRLARPAARS